MKEMLYKSCANKDESLAPEACSISFETDAGFTDVKAMEKLWI